MSLLIAWLVTLPWALHGLVTTFWKASMAHSHPAFLGDPISISPNLFTNSYWFLITDLLTNISHEPAAFWHHWRCPGDIWTPTPCLSQHQTHCNRCSSSPNEKHGALPNTLKEERKDSSCPRWAQQWVTTTTYKVGSLAFPLTLHFLPGHSMYY